MLTLALAIGVTFLYQDAIPRSRSRFQRQLAAIYKDVPPVTETYNKPSLLLNRDRDRVNVVSKEGPLIRGLTIQRVADGRLREVTFAEEARIVRRSKRLLRFEMERVSRLIIKDDYIDHPYFERLTIDIPISGNDADDAAGSDHALRTGAQLKKFFKNKDNAPKHRRKAELEYWLRMALAMSCFSLTLFAIPSGILSSQKSRTSGFIKSILYALVIFFPLLMGLRSFLTGNPDYPANLMLVPNWLFICYGSYLLWKVLKV
jgi:lipopolysaccharide export LptBFGC system permease protein LptF